MFVPVTHYLTGGMDDIGASVALPGGRSFCHNLFPRIQRGGIYRQDLRHDGASAGGGGFTSAERRQEEKAYE